ncbi:MAG: signal recognition particle-docking protein FtsY [Clostridiales bacterium]|nr:signal recognition particle-docking protein FtsY [Clostridiales bacterium]
MLENNSNEVKTKKSLFEKLQEGLSKTKKGMMDKIDNVFSSYSKIDDKLLEEIEEILIMSDVGMNTTMSLIEKLREEVKNRRITEAFQVKDVLKDIIKESMDKGDKHLLSEASPLVILVVGVNGAGKTTSIAKIAHKCKTEGRTVLLAAGDTFRAAAIEQLEIWGQRLDIHTVRHQEGSDPAAVIFDAVQSAKAKKVDVLICDTAGRLHNKKNLMNELEKIYKVLSREYPEAEKEVLLVLDAATGQNAIKQVKEFNEITDITGIVLTKLDGTAKGGIIISIAEEFDIPVKFIGVGEGMDDLQVFDAESFVEALF